MALPDLLAVCAPPSQPVYVPSAADWQQLENDLGGPLPDDYKALLDTFGSGSFGSVEEDGFFDLAWVLSPGHPPDQHQVNALPLMTQLTAKVVELRRRFPAQVPYPVWPEGGGLLLVGGTTTRNEIYWLTQGPPDAWSCAVTDWGVDEWFAWDGDLTSLLAAIVTQQVPDWIVEGPTAFPLVFRDLVTLRGLLLA